MQKKIILNILEHPKVIEPNEKQSKIGLFNEFIASITYLKHTK